MRKSERKTAMAVLRAAAIAAAVLAFVGLRLPLPTRARTLVLLLDVSDSIGREGIEASRAQALDLVRSLEPRDRVAALAFAGRTSLITPPIPPAQAASLLESASLSAPSPGSTDLSAALAAARELAAGGPGDRRICLFSDGRSNAGRALAETLAGAASSVGTGRRAKAAVDAVSEGRTSAGLVAQSLAAPELAHPGERVRLTWRLASPLSRDLGYRVLVDGKTAARGMASIKPGIDEVPIDIEAGSPGRHSIVVEPVGPGTAGPETRTAAYLDVGGAAKILVVSGGQTDSPIANALRVQGMDVETGGPEALPEDSSRYSGRAAVALDDLSALDITEAQQTALQEYVASGGGLLIVGGPHSLGRGEYYATPLEDMLPVSTDDRQRLLFTRAQLLFVIDHSGSMSERVGGETKQMIAMRGVAASIAKLNPLDEVGILGFDSSAAWVLPFTPASDRQRILGALSRLGEGGGTDLAVAMEEALKGFGDPSPTKRHAIVLTDGLTPDADFRDLCSRFSAAGVSVSTIGIGDEINAQLLQQIADWSGGRFYRSAATDIPTVIDKETVRMTRDLMQEGRVETRIAARASAVEGLGALPPVGGYLLTKLKSLADSLIEAQVLDQGSGTWDPLLASWRYGNGRVAVFTSDSGARWLSPWSGTKAYNLLWSQILRSIERPSPAGSLRASASVESGNAHIVVEAAGEDGRSASSLRLVGRATGAAVGSFGLAETAPGRYEGYVPLDGPQAGGQGDSGLAGFEILDPVTGERASTWAWRAPGLELSRLGADRTALSLIASSTGGRLLSEDSIALPPRATTWQSVSVRLPLVVLAALLLLADLYLRSTMAGQVGRAFAALLAWWNGSLALAEDSRAKRWPSHETTHDVERERRNAEMQMRMAERVARRYEKTDAAGNRND
jgi:Mg-chelatase subunit ChlD